ncbi:hypothetical protein QCA50_001301 [Cerrena zonata]|uniref:Uncharacterized protein n=1 Tax=Cerrena zonata TaxID=2478898 RepID=A0AAW0GSP3_9APHY
MQNDKLLHRLVHTRLLSGSLNEELDLTPAQRRKALAGRVLEAAGKAKLGKGENTVRKTERNKAAKHIRDGMQVKHKERHEKKVEEAKNMGNYHPAFKSLYDDEEAKHDTRRRDRGLKLGVGSFSGGVLKLRQRDIAAVSGGPSSRGRGRGRGRDRGGRGGGGRGGSGGRGRGAKRGGRG